MANVSLNLNNVQTGVWAGANSGFNSFLNPLKASTKPVTPPKNVALPTKTWNAAGMFSGWFWWVWTGWISNVTGKSLATLGRLNPVSEEDDLIKQALNYLDAWKPPADVYKAYPEVAKKLSIVADFKKDAIPRNETWDLFKAYPELSDSLKAEVFNQIKEFQKAQAAEQAAQQWPEIGSMVTEPVEPKKTFWQNVKDVWEGLVDFAAGQWVPFIPVWMKDIATSGILDEPMNRLNKKIWPQVRAAATALFGKKAMEDYQKSLQKPDWTPMKFSEFAALPQVWGDPNSKLAKWVSNVENWLQVVWDIAAIKGKMINNKITKTLLSDTRKWANKVTALGKIVPVLSDREKEINKVAGNVIKTGKTFTTNAARVEGAIKKEEWNLIKLVEKHNPVVSFSDTINKMKALPKPIMLKSDPVLAKSYDLAIQRFEDVLKSMPKEDWANLLKARKMFDSIVRDEFPNLYKASTSTPLGKAIKAVREVPNEVLDEAIGLWKNKAGQTVARTVTQGANWLTKTEAGLVKQSLNKQSLLSSAKEVLEKKAKKLEKAGSTKLSRYLQRNPMVKNIWRNVTQWAIAWWIFAWANKLIWWGSSTAANAPE